MKHHVIFWLCALFCSANADAATYYLDPTSGSDTNDGLTTGTAWKTLDKVSASTFSPDDIIDGQNYTYEGYYDAGGNKTNRLVVPSSGTSGHPIVFRNMTITGLISINGSLGINPAQTYGNAAPWQAYGAADTSGEIYKKASSRCPYQLTEDGVDLTPVVMTSSPEDQAIALTRGQFTCYSAILFYRASDGADPSTHDVKVARQDLNGTVGMVYTNAKSYLMFDNITVKYYTNNTAGITSFWAYNGVGVNITNSTFTKNSHGIVLDGLADSSFSSSSVIDNILAGVMLQGSNTNLSLPGLTIHGNGRVYLYNGTSYGYSGDTDGIGIGGSGGTMSGVSITDSIIYSNGPDDASSLTKGSGIYIGTSPYNMSIAGLTISRNHIYDNHNSGLNIGTVNQGVTGLTVTWNIFSDNFGNSGQTANAVHLKDCVATCTGVTLQNNIIANHIGGNSSVYVAQQNTAADPYVIQNNYFYNNAKASGYRAMLWFQYAMPAALVERNNWFYLSGSTNDSAKVIEMGSPAGTYDISHVVGGSAGYYQYASSRGQNDAVQLNPFTNAATGDWTHASYTAASIDAGYAVATGKDRAGNPIWGNPDIGAYEYQPPYTIGTDRMDTAGVRVYAGDQEGRFRTSATATGKGCRIAVSPENGTWADLASTDVRPAWADISSISCIVPGTATWTETPIAAGITNPRHRMFGMIAGRKYRVKLNGADAGSSITGCMASVCTADANGIVTWHLDGAFDTAKTWKVIEQNPRGFRPLNRQ